MITLQQPKFVHMSGGLRTWEDAVLHIGCEAATRGLTVFEGVKGYWRADGRFGLVMVRRHYERLRQSARLLHIPFAIPYDEYERAIHELAGALLEPGRDMWFRTTLFVTEGHWGEGTVADLVVTGYQTTQALPEAVTLGVSTWRRSVDTALPARIKTGSNYQVSRLARIEGRARGCEDMVLLNQEGRVAECTASCLLMVRAGTVYTPPPTEGALESITVDVMEALAQSLKINFVRRPIDRTELLVADELALTGTLTELVPVKAIDGFQMAPPTILRTLQSRYFDAMRGVRPHQSVQYSFGPVDLAVAASHAV